ncbi:hypothetical protein V8G54_018252 [Vigna mungo]|uniref:Uncharacterized protein n=1 Tax=Vigna mungo TaxID=3915 RepID=A0AAQ3RUK1_VIGMU
MQGKCVFFVFVRECAGCGVIWSNFLHFLKPVSKLYFRKLYVVDARPRKNALANGPMGDSLVGDRQHPCEETDLFGFENTWTLMAKHHQMDCPLSWLVCECLNILSVAALDELVGLLENNPLWSC